MKTTTDNLRMETVGQAAGDTRRVLLAAAQVVLFAGLTWVGANIVIPLVPVPITLQTLFVLLAGAMIGARKGALSQLVYVSAGAAGVPAFAGGASGLAILGGPTAGYLLSFLVVPLLVGAMLRRTNTLTGLVIAFVSGSIAIFALGVGWLAVGYAHSLAEAVQLGLIPFLPGAVFKVVAAVSIARSWQGIRAQRAGQQ